MLDPHDINCQKVRKGSPSSPGHCRCPLGLSNAIGYYTFSSISDGETKAKCTEPHSLKVNRNASHRPALP